MAAYKDDHVGAEQEDGALETQEEIPVSLAPRELGLLIMLVRDRIHAADADRIQRRYPSSQFRAALLQKLLDARHSSEAGSLLDSA